jgi:hypothetical protein
VLQYYIYVTCQVAEYGKHGLVLFWCQIEAFVVNKELQNTRWHGDSYLGMKILLANTLQDLNATNAVKEFDFGWWERYDHVSHQAVESNSDMYSDEEPSGSSSVSSTEAPLSASSTVSHVSNARSSAGLDS